VLTAAGDKKIQVIKVVREGVERDEADKLKSELEEAGGCVEGSSPGHTSRTEGRTAWRPSCCLQPECGLPQWPRKRAGSYAGALRKSAERVRRPR
jgi:hypothetical protein